MIVFHYSFVLKITSYCNLAMPIASLLVFRKIWGFVQNSSSGRPTLWLFLVKGLQD